jgi:hypothetical protein
MQTNLYAFTENTGASYPGYVSLNILDDGSVTLTVRSPGDFGKNSGTIVLPPKVLRALYQSIKYDALGEAGAGG